MRWGMMVLAVCGITACGGDDMPAVDDAGSDASSGIPCTTTSECDDGLFCNGAEVCEGTCRRGAIPCADTCDEDADECVESGCDTDGDGADAIACGGLDCDDTDPNRFPGATELCDDVDDDCDPTTFGTTDADGDGFVSSACCNDGQCGLDCNDARRGSNPDVPEVCDEQDNDCDGSIDEGVLITCYLDGDGDGYAPVGAAGVVACECPVRTTSRPPEDAADCDDTSVDVSPGLPEICSNGRDDDCDGTVDEAGNDWYRDCDGDGYGTGTPVRACTSPGTPAGCPGGGHVLVDSDCDDGDPNTFPGAIDRCDGARNDCDGTVTDGADATEWCNSTMSGLHAELTCTSGACQFSACREGYGDCSPAAGCETDVLTTPAHCGTCGNVCAFGLACGAGACGLQSVAAYRHSCAVGVDGRVWCWGNNADGQLGDGTTSQRTAPAEVSAIADAVEVAVGDSHSCALRRTGAVACWGDNTFGKLGDGTTYDRRTTPTPVSGLTDAVAVAVGTSHSCALRASGAVVCWGRGGHLGDGSTTGQSSTPRPVSELGDATHLAAGEGHTCARRASGQVVCWGTGSSGRLGDGTGANRTTPTAVSGLTDAVDVTAGALHSCAARATGGVVCWGDNGSGRLGDGTATDRPWPTPVSGLLDAVEVSAGYAHTCARRASGIAVCWGDNGYHRLGDGTTTERRTPTPVAGLTDSVEVSAGYSHTCARRAAGALVCWGSATGVSGATPALAGFFPAATDMAAGVSHTCAVSSFGSVFCWGVNGGGMLGDGTTAQRLRPTQVVDLDPVVQVVAADGHTCARLVSGSVACWGNNANGELGGGTTGSSYSRPRTVVGLADAVELVAGGAHTCARRFSGEVVCWGDNNYNQLGDGTTTDRPTPTAVVGLTDAVELAAGARHTCARRASGRIVCWGDNQYGQIGDGTTTDRPAVTSTSITDAVELVAGAVHSCARRMSGGVVCWGNNRFGQLGDGTSTQRNAPTPVPGLSNVVELAAAGRVPGASDGGDHTCARLSSGGVVCWGDNQRGQIGDGTVTRRPSPTAVSGLTDATRLALGTYHSCAGRPDGSIVCWGLNSGRLGDGTLLERHTHVDVVGFAP